MFTRYFWHFDGFWKLSYFFLPKADENEKVFLKCLLKSRPLGVWNGTWCGDGASGGATGAGVTAVG